jgi:hypothetical protein
MAGRTKYTDYPSDSKIRLEMPETFLGTKKVSPYACELELPVSIRIHREQPISLLDPVVEDPLDGQVVLPPPPVEVDSEEEYQVLSVEDS